MNGILKAKLGTRSIFLSNFTPIEIRDDKIKLVKTVSASEAKQGIELDPGLYEVSVVLDNGKELNELVRIETEQTTSIELSEKVYQSEFVGEITDKKAEEDAVESITMYPGMFPNWRNNVNIGRPNHQILTKDLKESIGAGVGSGIEELLPPAKVFRQSLGVTSPDSEGFAIESDDSAFDAVTSTQHVYRKNVGRIQFYPVIEESKFQMSNVDQAMLVSEEELTWRFNSLNRNIVKMPAASFVKQDKHFSVSLPINPISSSELESGCEVTMDPVTNRPTSWISESRMVARTIQNLLVNYKTMNAAELLLTADEAANSHQIDEADNLLYEKYRDPVGAVLGALVLYKVGKLRNRIHWVSNLARDFEWLSDGKILLAKLLADNLEDPEMAKQLIQDSLVRRPLLTESFSILLELVRCWPWKDETFRKDALSQLSKLAPLVQWECFCFTLKHPTEVTLES